MDSSIIDTLLETPYVLVAVAVVAVIIVAVVLKVRSNRKLKVIRGSTDAEVVEKERVHDEQSQDAPPSPIATPMTFIGEYCLTDTELKLPSGKVILYEDIDSVEYKKDFESYVVLTFRKTWQITLKAGPQTRRLYEELTMKVNTDEVRLRMERKRRNMLRSGNGGQ